MRFKAIDRWRERPMPTPRLPPAHPTPHPPSPPKSTRQHKRKRKGPRIARTPERFDDLPATAQAFRPCLQEQVTAPQRATGSMEPGYDGGQQMAPVGGSYPWHSLGAWMDHSPAHQSFQQSGFPVMTTVGPVVLPLRIPVPPSYSPPLDQTHQTGMVWPHMAQACGDMWPHCGVPNGDF